jgi:hypothetical protein
MREHHAMGHYQNYRLVSRPSTARLGIPKGQLMIDHDKQRISIQPSASMQARAILFAHACINQDRAVV